MFEQLLENQRLNQLNHVPYISICLIIEIQQVDPMLPGIISDMDPRYPFRCHIQQMYRHSLCSYHSVI
ncbi:hypothetical protein KNP414_04502 [Paenibacillus mucilaginosus KNP414]|uniref:Uncharacterized protein n=1 Tax=Paenibacillus mucilaginosus (strain KNP414) TaxID=1036673 RepID=F8F9A4_PAEMK|nr:hypothetical protein KNP414_04502 [Paenibacillus mucilaginosus KNP414]